MRTPALAPQLVRSLQQKRAHNGDLFKHQKITQADTQSADVQWLATEDNHCQSGYLPAGCGIRVTEACPLPQRYRVKAANQRGIKRTHSAL
jgi:hypothetical protein